MKTKRRSAVMGFDGYCIFPPGRTHQFWRSYHDYQKQTITHRSGVWNLMIPVHYKCWKAMRESNVHVLIFHIQCSLICHFRPIVCRFRYGMYGLVSIYRFSSNYSSLFGYFVFYSQQNYFEIKALPRRHCRNCSWYFEIKSNIHLFSPPPSLSFSKYKW